MRTRNVLTIVLAIVMVFAMTPVARAEQTYNFDDGTVQGWTVTTGLVWFEGGNRIEAGRPDEITPTTIIRGYDGTDTGTNPTFVFTSPAFYLDPVSTSDLTATLEGGDSRIPNPSPTLTGVLGITESLFEAGFSGFALRNITTDTYEFWQTRGGSGGGATEKAITAAQLDTLDPNAQYAIDFIDYNWGGWGWTSFDNVSIPGTQNLIASLTWDGDVGEWGDIDGDAPGDSHWDGGELYAIPDADAATFINSGQATVVRSGQNAYHVGVTAGELRILGGDLTTNAINSATEVTIGSGGMLTASSGTLSSTLIGTGNGTISNSGDMTIGSLSILDNSTLIKQGAGKLTASANGTISVVNAAVKVSAGELVMQPAADLARIELDGGVFTMSAALANLAPGGALANWKFNETAGTTAVDSTGGNDGSIGASITLNQAARPGAIGTSFYFPDGANTEELVTAAGIELNNRSFSLAAWVKREAPNADYFFGQGTGGGNTALHAGFRNNQEATFAFYGNDSDHNNVQYDNTEWHHLVFTYDADTNDRHIYWDNVDQPVDDNPASADYQGTGTFRIGGRWDGNDNFQGWLDDVYVYQSTLDSTAVNTLFIGESYGPISATSTDVIVTNTSTLNANSSTADFGALSFMTNNDTTLNVTGVNEGISFSSTTLDGAMGVSKVTINTPASANLGLISDATGPVEIVKTGAGDLILNTDLSTTLTSGGTKFNISGGSNAVVTDQTSLGSASVELNGGGLVLDTTAHAPGSFTAAVTSAGGANTLTAGQGAGSEHSQCHRCDSER